MKTAQVRSILTMGWKTVSQIHTELRDQGHELQMMIISFILEKMVAGKLAEKLKNNGTVLYRRYMR